MTKNANDNPLLSPLTLPNGAYPLDSVKPEHYLPALRKGIEEARAEVATIKNNPEAPNFKNTIEALEFIGKTKNLVESVFGNISGANINDELQAIEDDMDKESVNFSSELMLDPVIFSRVKAVYDARASLTLTPEQNMLLEETYKGFVRSGAELDEAGKKRFHEISEKLSELATAYKNNTLASVKAYKKVIDNEDDLKGVPERAKANYRAAAEKEGLQGKWLIRLSPPPVDILQYAENRALREEIQRAVGSVAWKKPQSKLGAAFEKAANWLLRKTPEEKPDNAPVVMEMVKLRHEKARLLGFENYAAFVLDNRMAKTPETVTQFLDKNESVYRPAAEQFLQKVKDYALKTDGVKDLQPWDMAYYGRKLKEETYNIKLEELRPYFNLEKVLDGLRQHAEKLFNIEMQETKDKYPVYHPDVKVYEIKDKASGEMIGLFYADYFARPGAKRSGAWMNNIRGRGLEDGENKFAHVVNVCNFQKPPEGKPCELPLDEIRTVFHEFGHGLHSLLSKGNYKSLTGTNVKWDFVELPSQLQENWAQQKEVLDTFARHPVTNEPLSDELIKKIHDMENFDAGYFGLRQTFQAKLDMTWHTTNPDKIGSVEELEDAVLASSWLFPRTAGPMSTNFGHLFSGGYAAGYYSYKWAAVLDADIFEPFKEKGLYDEELKTRLRSTIYTQGGTVEPSKLFEDMMGRAPDQDALFRREGLLPANNNAPAKAKPPQTKP